MHYKGILITDAMNMGGLAGYSEEKASLMALKAGVDIILHPSNPAKVASYLSKAGFIPGPDLLTEFRSQLRQHQALLAPDFEGHAAISGSLTSKAIRVSGDFRISGPPLLVLLNDEGERRGAVFARRLKAAYPGMRVRTVTGNSAQHTIKLPDHIPLIVAVFSETRGWKGGTGSWVREKLEGLGERADLLVSFGSPYLLNPAGDVPRMFVYWDSVMAEEAAARLILYYND